MSDLVRFSVSLENELLVEFDRYVQEGRFATRSEAIRQLLRQTLIHDVWEADIQQMTATLTLVYDHHKSHLVEKLLEIQHQHGEMVISSLHVHLDHDHCMEVIVLKGKGSEIRSIAEQMRGLKGVHKGELTIADTAGPAASHHHRHGHRHRH